MGLKLKVGQDSRAADPQSAALAALPVEVEFVPGKGMRVRIPQPPKGKTPREPKVYACLPVASEAGGWACRLIEEGAGDAHEGYLVSRGKDGWRCECDAWKYKANGEPCKHILAAVTVQEALEPWTGKPAAVAPPEPLPKPPGRSLMEMAYGAEADAKRRLVAERQHARKERERLGYIAGMHAGEEEARPVPLPQEVRQALAEMESRILGAVAKMVPSAKE